MSNEGLDNDTVSGDPDGAETREQILKNLRKMQRRANTIATQSMVKGLTFPGVPKEPSIDLTEPHINN